MLFLRYTACRGNFEGIDQPAEAGEKRQGKSINIGKRKREVLTVCCSNVAASLRASFSPVILRKIAFAT